MPNGSAIATTHQMGPVPLGPVPLSSSDPNRPNRLEAMFRAHHAVVWRTLRRRGLGPEAAADATQQCFLIAAERLKDIRADSERAFLLGTALRIALSAFRSSQRWQLGEDMDLRASHTSGAEEALDQRRLIELLDRALSRLDPDLLEVFVLFELEGLSTPEIAALVDIPLGTAASRLRRARESFKVAVARMERVMRREVAR